MLYRDKEENLKMKYMGDSDWWNARFKDRKLNIMMHEQIS